MLTDAEGCLRAADWDVAPELVYDVDDLLRRSGGDASAGNGDLAPPDPVWLTPSNLAYLIYTSGTTGRPKAVMIEHRSIANLVASNIDYFRLRPGDRVTQSSSAAWDSSVEEVWLPLAVRDVYEARTVAGLAERARLCEGGAAAKRVLIGR